MRDERLRVRLPGHGYDVQLAAGWGGLTRSVRRLGLGPRVLLVSDTRVARLHAGAARDALRDAGFEVGVAVLAGGETGKTLAAAARLYEIALDRGLDRHDTVVAVGGGVIGDLAGWMAASYLRGIALVHVPTTLLAMVDASVGGKTGVNLRRGKNLVGAFHQPRLVYANLNTLATLPRRQLRAGLAEVIKGGMIRDPLLIRHLERRLDAVLDLESGPLRVAVRRALAVKIRIVVADEREAGLRALLNYGHTVGHAIETVTGYRRYLHGEAVALGMMAAAHLGREIGVTALATAERQERLLRSAGLPTSARGVDRAAVLRSLRLDKKMRAGRLRFVLTSRVGSASVHAHYPVQALARAVAAITPR